MEETVSEQQEMHAKDANAVTIRVNNRPVIFQDHETNGLEIKRTAIQQGLSIEEDFNLFRVKGGGNLDPIRDAEIVLLHKDEEFRATAPDDNSEAAR
jgi:hypothetical protein